MDFESLKARYWESKQWKDRWLARYQQLYFYVIPDRDAFNVKFGYQDPGKPLTEQIWDSTAMIAAYRRANDLHGILIPQDRIWGKLTMDEHQFSQEEIAAFHGELDTINERIFYYLNKSNIARAVSASNLDLVGGTAALWFESPSDDKPLVYRSIPAVALYPEYSNDDVLETGWYQCKMTNRSVLESFPKYRGPHYKGMCDKPDEMTTVLYGQIKMSEDKYYIYSVLDSDQSTPLWERESSYPQILMYRDRVRPGEAEGRGIGLDMLPMIITLNKTVMYSQKNLALTAQPPLFVDDDSYFNPYSVYQWAGAIFRRHSGGRNPIEALQMPVASDVLPKVQMLQNQIIDAFQVDPLGEINSPVKSATEIATRENRAQRTSATDIARLINELPRQIFDVAVKALSERRLLNKERDMVITPHSRKKLRFDYVSPLYDIQAKEDIYNFTANMQIKEQFFGQGAAISTLDPIAANEWLNSKFNLPHKIFKDTTAMQKQMAMMAKMSSMQQQLQEMGPVSQGQPAQLPGPQPIQF